MNSDMEILKPFEQFEPDEIDLMDENELRAELRGALLKLSERTSQHEWAAREVDRIGRELAAAQSRLDTASRDIATFALELHDAKSRLGRAVDLLRCLTESFDANVTREAAEFVRENTPRIDPESVRGILKDSAVERQRRFCAHGVDVAEAECGICAAG